MKKRLWMLVLVVLMAGAGCLSGTAETVQIPSCREDTVSNWEAYMTSVKEQADRIRASLEQDVLTQLEMKEKSHELCALWDDALNDIWAALKRHLPEEELTVLQEDQDLWMNEREKAAQEAGRGVEGGSLYALVVSETTAEITQERVCELYEMLKQMDE